MYLDKPDQLRGTTGPPRPPQYPPPESARAAIGQSSTRPQSRLDPMDKRQVFKQMVVGTLESGFLRYSKRKVLLDYAARIGISEFDAMLLIAEDQIEPAQIDSALVLAEPPRVETWSLGTRLLIALGLAAALDVTLICWLFV
jgi:hypothetical protein